MKISKQTYSARIAHNTHAVGRGISAPQILALEIL